MQPDLSHDHIHHSGSKNKLEQDVLAFPSPVQGFFFANGVMLTMVVACGCLLQNKS